MAVFVTVGTTSFDELIEKVNSFAFHSAIMRLGYDTLFVQYGNGSIEPSTDSLDPSNADFLECKQSNSILKVHAFRYHDNLGEFFSRCELVISHGGAGTCLESLTPPGRRKLVIVINEALMHNHQLELAAALYMRKHAFVTRPSDLISFLMTGQQRIFPELPKELSADVDVKTLLGPSSSPESVGLVPFHRGDRRRLLQYLDEILGLVHE
ncbi:hypothetical protein AAHC03_0344 [Spirometra sp. Aus1]